MDLGPHVIVLLLVVFCGLYVTVTAGLGRAVAVVYLPSVLLLSMIQDLAKPTVLDLNGYTAAVYGILLGLPLTRERFTFRPHLIDLVVVVLSIIVILSSAEHGEFYTGVSYGISEFLERLCPYFLCRIAFARIENRRAALRALIVCATFIMLPNALIEVRIRPQWVHHVLASLHIGRPPHALSLYRWGLFRVYGFTPHPIYAGNISLVLLGFLVVFAKTTGRKLSDRWVLIGLCSAAACLFMSLSFTPIFGALAAGGIYAAVRYQKGTRFLLIPGVIAGVIGMVLVTQFLATQPISKTENASDLQSSYEVRQLIIRGAYELAAKAPTWGYGHDFEWTEYELSSVDNSYLVFAILFGPYYLWIFVSLALLIAIRATKVLGTINTDAGRVGIAAGTAVLLGIMLAMYTVWAGAIYTVFWFGLLGLMMSVYDWTLWGAPVAVSGTPASVRR